MIVRDKDKDAKKWITKSLIMLAEAVVFGIGIEVGKDIYAKIKSVRNGEEKSPDVIDPESCDQ